MALITTTYGKESRCLGVTPLRTVGLKAYPFIMQYGGQEFHLFIALKEAGRRVGGKRFDNDHGDWSTYEYQIPAASIIKFFVSRQESGAVQRCQGAYFYIDEAAPVLTASVPGIEGGGGSGICPMIQGPLRLITPAEHAVHGIEMSPALRGYYAAPERDFEIAVDRPVIRELLGARALDL